MRKSLAIRFLGKPDGSQNKCAIDNGVIMEPTHPPLSFRALGRGGNKNSVAKLNSYRAREAN